LSLGSLPVLAQLQAPASAQEATAPVFKVGSITVKFVGAANVNEQVVRANMQVREGGD
jgi:outer membrane protein insertion porin family